MGSPHLTPDDTTAELWKDNEFATADEGQPLALFAGEALLAPVWVSPIYNLRAEEADGRASKK